MPKITKLSIQEKNKNRCNVFVDGCFFIALPIELVYKHSLKVGLEIIPREFEQIVFEKERSEALSKATNYVTKTLKTKKQVLEYLLGKGYNQDTVNYCLDKLIEYRLIDDEEYAKRFIESVSKGEGVNLTRYKLMMKGLNKQVIENIYNDAQIDSKENAKNLAVKRMKNKEINKENLSKTYRYLISKGFTYDDATYAIDCIKEMED